MLRTQSLGKNLQPAASDFPAAQYIETLIFLSIRPLTSGNRHNNTLIFVSICQPTSIFIFSSRDIGVWHFAKLPAIWGPAYIPYAPKKSASPLVLPVPLFNPLT